MANEGSRGRGGIPDSTDRFSPADVISDIADDFATQTRKIVRQRDTDLEIRKKRPITVRRRNVDSSFDKQVHDHISLIQQANGFFNQEVQLFDVVFDKFIE